MVVNLFCCPATQEVDVGVSSMTEKGGMTSCFRKHGSSDGL